jgi:hypothetical protein
MNNLQLSLFEIESVGEAYKPYPFDLSNDEHIKQAIAWQKKNSYPLFEPKEEIEWIPVYNWEYEVDWEINYEYFDDFDDAFEAAELSEEEDNWTTSETNLKIKIDGRKVYETSYHELVELIDKKSVAETMECFGVEFKYQGKLHTFKYNFRIKEYDLYKTKDKQI